MVNQLDVNTINETLMARNNKMNDFTVIYKNSGVYVFQMTYIYGLRSWKLNTWISM